MKIEWFWFGNLAVKAGFQHFVRDDSKFGSYTGHRQRGAVWKVYLAVNGCLRPQLYQNKHLSSDMVSDEYYRRSQRPCDNDNGCVCGYDPGDSGL